MWPEGLSHYVGVHRVRLPAAFVEYVRDRVNALEDATAVDEWWIETTTSVSEH
jgi:hypothetical protein